MIYPVRLYTADGYLKGGLSVKHLSKKYWQRFQEEEKKRRKRSLKFGKKTQLQKFLSMERMVDELTHTKMEYEDGTT